MSHARGGAVVLAGPPGAGKTTLLRSLGRRLAGCAVVYLDLMAAASSPDRFVAAALEALAADRFGPRLAEATAIRRLAAAGRERGSEAVAALFSLWSSLKTAGTERRPAAGRGHGDPVPRLLPRPAPGPPALRQGPGGARRRHAPRHVVPDPGATPLVLRRPSPPSPKSGRCCRGRARAQAAERASFGWPRYVRAIAESWRPGDDVAAAWAREMAVGGRLESACRHTYESLLLRSRGYGISKAVLGAVAHEEGLNLTALVVRLGRTPGAVRDYLQWLVGVDALRMVGKRYVYVDGLLRAWVRLHAQGPLPPPGTCRRDRGRDAGGRRAGSGSGTRQRAAGARDHRARARAGPAQTPERSPHGDRLKASTTGLSVGRAARRSAVV